MIDLTPLDVRNKRGDFKKLMRGYDPREVDVFLELVAERLEQLVRENLQLRDRSLTLQSQVDAQTGREQAVQEALVTAQELRAGIQAQSQREADHILKEAEAEARRVLAEADAEVRDRLRGIERRLDQGQDELADLERRRARFLQEFRGLLQRELDVIKAEEQRAPVGVRSSEGDVDRAPAKRERAPAAIPVAAAPVAAYEERATPTPSEPELETESEISGESEITDESEISSGSEIRVGSEARTEPAPAPAVAAVDVDVESPEEARPDAPSSGPVATREATTQRLEVSAAGGREISADELVDVRDLRPEPEAQRPSAPPAAVGPEPSTLELELMAGSAGERIGAGDGAGSRGPFEGIPDLETVLAEAGVEEVRPPPPPQDFAPPAPSGTRPDNLILFDPNDRERKR